MDVMRPRAAACGVRTWTRTTAPLPIALHRPWGIISSSRPLLLLPTRCWATPTTADGSDASAVVVCSVFAHKGGQLHLAHLGHQVALQHLRSETTSCCVRRPIVGAYQVHGDQQTNVKPVGTVHKDLYHCPTRAGSHTHPSGPQAAFLDCRTAACFDETNGAATATFASRCRRPGGRPTRTSSKPRNPAGPWPLAPVPNMGSQGRRPLSSPGSRGPLMLLRISCLDGLQHATPTQESGHGSRATPTRCHALLTMPRRFQMGAMVSG
jgi:hypothetical protein